MVPVVAIVGRPNVGKSTLFNRLTGKRRALVANEPGLTRDRHYSIAEWDSRSFQLVDTGGFESDATTGIDAAIRMQTETAIGEANLVLVVLDVRDGLTSTDRDLVEMLRRSGKPVLHVANKADGPRQEAGLAEFGELGVPRLFAVSAEHGRGFDELIDSILSALPPAPADTPATDEARIAEGEVPIRIALVGRPNAGKSALLNRLVGAERAIVSDVPGTTRDPIDASIESPHGHFTIVDTAGIRRKRRAAPFMEQIAVLRAQRCIYDSDVACLILDANDGVAAQDAKIATSALDAGRGLVLVFTKSDLLGARGRARERVAKQLDEKLHFADFAPHLLLSAVTGKGVDELLPTVKRVHQQLGRRISTGELNRFIAEVTRAHGPPAHRGRPVRLYYATQAQTHPPSFVLSTNHPDGVPPSYRRYLVNRIRKTFGFSGAPIRLFVRKHAQR